MVLVLPASGSNDDLHAPLHSTCLRPDLFSSSASSSYLDLYRAPSAPSARRLRFALPFPEPDRDLLLDLHDDDPQPDTQLPPPNDSRGGFVALSPTVSLASTLTSTSSSSLALGAGGGRHISCVKILPNDSPLARPEKHVKMLNGRVYGAKRRAAQPLSNPFANTREEPEFVEWGYGGTGTVHASAGANDMWKGLQRSDRGGAFQAGFSPSASPQAAGAVTAGSRDSEGCAASPVSRQQMSDSNGVPENVDVGGGSDKDDGSGMAWVKRRRAEREAKARLEQEAKELDRVTQSLQPATAYPAPTSEVDHGYHVIQVPSILLSANISNSFHEHEREPLSPGDTETTSNLPGDDVREPSWGSDEEEEQDDVDDYEEHEVLDVGGKTALGAAVEKISRHDRVMSLSNLALHLFTRHKQLGGIQDLHEAIALNREALNLRPQGHPDRTMSLNNLADSLSTRYDVLGEMRDLNEAIVLDRAALDLHTLGHPLRSMTLNNLATRLSARYKQLGEIDDLHEAIVLGRKALGIFLPGNPHRSYSLHCLVYRLHTRFMQLRKMEDREELFSLYAELENAPHLVYPDDLSTAKAWVDTAEDMQHPTTLLAYETSLRLLIQHMVNLSSSPQHLVTLKKLTWSLAVDVFSACLRKHVPTLAIELLELGLGIFWSQLTHLRSPLDDVIVFRLAGKTLANEFTRLTSLLHNALRSPHPVQRDRAWQLDIQLKKVLSDIRHLPGLSRFLLPPLCLDLQLVATEGPVIIVNASKYSCDALVVLLEQDPIHISLQITAARVRELSSNLCALMLRVDGVNITSDLAVILRELWDQVVSPIVERLLTMYPSHSRIWWCPMAEFSRLPLHAAGPYRIDQQNLDDLYISSYTTTLTALIRARRRYSSSSITERKRFLAIGQSHAIGESTHGFDSSPSQLACIARCLEDITTFTRIEGPECTVSRVSEELSKNQWVHIACRSLPGPKQPFESAFALHDGRFTIKPIIQCNLQDPQFAYLSGCPAPDGDESPDSGAVIHLASVMQLIGFRSVVGTMWVADDAYTPRIASTFYQNMIDESGRLDHACAAFALHKTMKTLVDIPFDQRMLYVHFGA